METELERLVVRITGDGSEYQRMMQQAQTSTADAAKNIERHASEVEGFGSKLRGYAQTALAALASLGAGAWLRSAFGEFSEAEQAGVRLETMIRAGGRTVDSVMPMYREFASTVQELTTMQDDSVIALLSQAESFGISGEAARAASQDAIAFAAINGGNAEQYLRFTVAMQRGDTEMMQSMARMIPQLRGITDQTELMAKANQLAAAGWQAAQAEAQTASGRIKQLKNAYGDLMEEIGGTVANVIKPLVDGAKEVVKWFQELPGWIKESITYTAILVTGVLAIGSAIAIAAAIFNTGFGGIGLIIGGIVTGTVALGAWISQLQIAADAWSWIKERSMEFWNWLRPVVRAGIGYMTALWHFVTAVVIVAWSEIKRVALATWNAISEFMGGFGVDWSTLWNDMRNVAVMALINAEFVVRNFGAVVDYVWLSIRVGWMAFVGEFTHFFSSTLPRIIAYFAVTFVRVVRNAFNFLDAAMINMAANATRLAMNLPRLLSGDLTLGNFMRLWRPMAQSFDMTIGQFPAMTERAMGNVERELREQWLATGARLDADWQQFRDRRLREIFGPDVEQMRNRGREGGREMGRGMAEGMRQEIQGFEHVFRFSAEAQSRIRAQLESIRGNPLDRPRTAGARAVPMAIVPPAAGGQQSETNTILRNIHEAMLRGIAMMRPVGAI
jgi:hypothetical protein